LNSLCAEADDLAHPPRESHQPKCIVVISSQAAGGSLYPVYVHGVPCGIFSHWSVESKRRLTSLSQDSASGPVCMSSVVDVHRKWTVCCLAEGVRRSFCLICRNLRTFALATIVDHRARSCHVVSLQVDCLMQLFKHHRLAKKCFGRQPRRPACIPSRRRAAEVPKGDDELLACRCGEAGPYIEVVAT